MNEQISEMWEVGYSATNDGGIRVSKCMDVFARGRGEARETAIREAEESGFKNVVLHSAVQVSE